MIAFRFELDDVEDIAPWGEPEKPDLHWFALTAGRYWIEADSQELLRYSDGSYADYCAVRLWEDVLALLPDLASPVPAELLPYVADPGLEFPATDEAEAALDWYCDHDMYMGPLVGAPHVRLWRNPDDTIELHWWRSAARPELFDCPERGSARVPAAEFDRAVQRLHDELITAMDERITALERGDARAQCQIDLAQLRAEHQDRAQWLERRRGVARERDWSAILAGCHAAGAPGAEDR